MEKLIMKVVEQCNEIMSVACRWCQTHFFCNLWCDIFISNSLNFCCQSCLCWFSATVQVYLRYRQKRRHQFSTVRPGSNQNCDKTTNMPCASGIKDKGGKAKFPHTINWCKCATRLPTDCKSGKSDMQVKWKMFVAWTGYAVPDTDNAADVHGDIEAVSYGWLPGWLWLMLLLLMMAVVGKY